MILRTIIIAHLYSEGSAASNRIMAYASGFKLYNKKVVLVLASDRNFDIPSIKGVEICKCIGKHSLQAKLMSKRIKEIYNNNCVILIYGTPILCWYLSRRKYNIFYECTEIPFYGKERTYKSVIIEKIKMYLAKRATGMLVISQSLKEYFISKGIRNIEVVNMFVDINRFANVPIDRVDDNYIAYCGQVSVFKDGVDCLIKSFKIFQKKHKDYKLYIIGNFISSEDESKIKSLVSYLGLLDFVIFMGLVHSSQIPEILCGAKMLALARPRNKQSQYGFPTKLGEYLATGKPVIVTDVGEIGSFLKDGVNCRMAKPNDIEDFAEKLIWVADNYECALRLGVEGRTLTESKFSYLEQSKRALDFFEHNSIDFV